MKLEIKCRYTSKVLFEHDQEDNTIRATVEKAVELKANLRGAGLSDALNYDFIKHTIVPQEGAFVGFKKICTSEGKKVIKVLIPENAKRVGGVTGRKCRAEFVQILEGVDGWSDYDPDFKYQYKAGDIARPDSFNDSLFSECEAGIHFFITRQEAIDY